MCETGETRHRCASKHAFESPDDGRNDELQFSADRVAASFSSYIRTVRRLYPHATIVEILPWFIGGNRELPAIVDSFTTVAKRYDAVVIDPNTEGWLPGPAGTVAPDRIHPTTTGHAYAARHLIADFRDLIGLTPGAFARRPGDRSHRGPGGEAGARQAR